MPSLARSPDQIGVQPVSDEPTISPAGGSAGEVPQAAPTGVERTTRGPDGKRTVASTTPPHRAADLRQQAAAGRRKAFDPRVHAVRRERWSRRRGAGTPVREIDPPKATRDRLALNWPATTDNVGVVGYKIWLDGFPVASTAETHAELRWFNDDATQHVVQIRAIDAAGNQSTSSPALVVTRPTPEPTPTPTPEPSTSPTPDPSASQPNPSETSPPPAKRRPRAPRPPTRPTDVGTIRWSRAARRPVRPDPAARSRSSDAADACRIAIAPFAELERAPEHIHTYRLTPLGLWNARAAGHDAEQVVDTLLTYSRYPVPTALLVDVADTMDRYGRLRIEKHPTHGLVLVDRPAGADRGVAERQGQGSGRARGSTRTRWSCTPVERGHLKQVLLKLGWPAEDLAGYVDGEAHAD